MDSQFSTTPYRAHRVLSTTSLLILIGVVLMLDTSIEAYVFVIALGTLLPASWTSAWQSKTYFIFVYLLVVSILFAIFQHL